MVAKEEILEQIKTAEENVQQDIEIAQKETAEVLADTRREAQQILDREAAEAETAANQIITKGLNEIETYRQERNREQENELSILETKLRGRIAAVVEHLHKKFEVKLHA